MKPIALILVGLMLSTLPGIATEQMLVPFYGAPVMRAIVTPAPIMHAPSIYSAYQSSVYFNTGLSPVNDIYYRAHYPVLAGRTYFDWTGIRRFAPAPVVWRETKWNLY